jgi:pyruvate formate lyase activating enzyme
MNRSGSKRTDKSTAPRGELPLSGLIFDIKRYAVHDGPGIRLTVFFKGCPLNCWWCHNPEGKVPEVEKVERYPGDSDPGSELIGEVRTVDQIMKTISGDTLFFDESRGGVTFSGGEPLMQPEFLSALTERCHNQGIHTALDTCGYAPEDVFRRITKQIDLFLYDLKFIDANLHRTYTGVDNELILNNLKTLNRLARPVIIRFPVIPEINSTDANVAEISDFLSDLKHIRTIDLLPFHHFAKRKYCRLKVSDRMKEAVVPASHRLDLAGAESSGTILNSIRDRFEARGFTVNIGG